MEELLSEEALASGKVQGDALILEGSDYMAQEVGVVYEPAYVCVMSNAQNEKQAAEFIEMLLTKAS